MRVLRWKTSPESPDLAPHELRLMTQPGCVKVILEIQKLIPQTLVINIIGVSEEVFEAAWKKQGGCWQQTEVQNTGNRFFAIRYIDFGNNTYLVWRVVHIENRPYDLLDMFYGDVTEMRQLYRSTN